jgi:hypothetical protein
MTEEDIAIISSATFIIPNEENQRRPRRKDDGG